MIETKEKAYGIIYKATNKVNGKSYIGQTTKSLQIRKAAHIRDHGNERLKKLAFYEAMKKYSPEGFDWEIIDYAATEEEINNKEVYWITHYKTNKGNGYNMTAGGQGVKNYKVTEEGIQRRKDVLNRMWANGHATTVQRGEDASNSKYKNEDIRNIVKLLIEGKSYEEIAILLGVDKSIVGTVKNRSGWKHLISDEEYETISKLYRRTDEDITEKDVLEIKDLLLKTDIPSLEIYSLYNLNHNQFGKIIYRTKFSELFTEEEIKISRNRRGARNLTIDEVVEIKELLQDELYTQKEISLIYDITSSRVSAIGKGERWGNILINLPMEDIEDYDWQPIDWRPQKPNRKN